jgi:hypothetical protein
MDAVLESIGAVSSLMTFMGIQHSQSEPVSDCIIDWRAVSSGRPNIALTSFF